MKSKILVSALCLLPLLVPAMAKNSSAQGVRGPVHFGGVLNDYTQADPTVKGSPWEMHGQWSLDLHEWGDSADFYADMTMSDYGSTNGTLDSTKGGQAAHTHHIRLTNVRVTWNMTGCPAYPTPVTIGGFQLNGTVSLITGNGSVAPFETTPPSSMLQVCVSGGTEVPFSNMTMVFQGPATTHFGTQAIHGVVRKPPIKEGQDDGRR
jgi:hypothetical protein